MTAKIKDIIIGLDQEAPFSLAEEWDNVGLLVGDPEQDIRSVLIGLDPTNALVDEAIQRGADTILTHHPVIFRPIPNIITSTPEGKILQKAIRHNISIISCHTNLDSATEGVSDILGTTLGLTKLTPLVPSSDKSKPGTGLGRTGIYDKPLTIADFITTTLEVLGLEALQAVGPLPEMVQKVAICGGSGSDLAEIAYSSGADIYLTAEVKHNVARWAEERDFCIIDGGHYGTEQLAVRLLAEKLERLANANSWNIQIMQTDEEKPPFIWLHKDSLTQE